MTILSITAAALTLLAFLLCVGIALGNRKRYRKELSDLRSKLWEAMFSGKDTRIRFGFGDAEDSQEIYSKGLKAGAEWQKEQPKPRTGEEMTEFEDRLATAFCEVKKWKDDDNDRPCKEYAKVIGTELLELAKAQLTWQDVKEIVNIADMLIISNEPSKFPSEKRFYEEVADEYNRLKRIESSVQEYEKRKKK